MKTLAPIQHQTFTSAQLAQVKQGGAGGNSGNVNNTNVPQTLLDTAGNAIRLVITPETNCYWEVTATSIWHSPDNVWSAIRAEFFISPADVNGLSSVNQEPTHAHLPATVAAWSGLFNICTFKLGAGITYTLNYRAAFSSNHNQIYYTGWPHIGIEGRTFGHGVF